MSLVTLRIKRKHFDAILDGTKHVEYRDVKPFYTSLLERRQVSALKLHYQSSRQVIVEVLGVDKIPCPQHLKNFGEYVYAIRLGKSCII